MPRLGQVKVDIGESGEYAEKYVLRMFRVRYMEYCWNRRMIKRNPVKKKECIGERGMQWRKRNTKENKERKKRKGRKSSKKNA